MGLRNSKFGSSSPPDKYGHEKPIIRYRAGGREESMFVIMFSVVNAQGIIGSGCAICCIFSIA